MDLQLQTSPCLHITHAGFSDQQQCFKVFGDLPNGITSCMMHSLANMAVVVQFGSVSVVMFLLKTLDSEITATRFTEKANG